MRFSIVSAATASLSLLLLAPLGCGASSDDSGSSEDALKGKPKICGGIAALQCGADEECVDNPNDGCDPDKNGADCAGICKPRTGS